MSELAPGISIVPTLRTGAGTPVAVRAILTNHAAEPRVLSVAVLGVDPSWLPAPSRGRPVMPGAGVEIELPLRPAAGTVPARYPLTVAVQALDPVTGKATAPTALATVELVVDAPGQVGVEIAPTVATAVFGKRLTIFLQNTGTAAADVRLEVQSPQSIRVQLAAQDVSVAPGERLPVRGRVRVLRPRLFGARYRHAYTVTARGTGAPRHAEGAFTARAALGPGGTKLAALAAVVAVWVALAAIFIPKLANTVRTKQAAPATSTSIAPGPSGSGSSGSGSSGGSSGPSGSGGGSGSASGGGGASGGAAGASGGAVTNGPVQINGTVTGNSPSGVDVSIAPTSLVDEQAQGATPVGVSPQSLDEIGKIPESAVRLQAPSTVSPDRSTVTGTDGAWSFPKVAAPGYYLVTFAKPGYQTQRYVIDSSSAAAQQPLQVAMVPGQGKLSGVITGPAGPVGGAQITITDGTNTVTTSSASTGNVGQWSVDGLSTPSNYLVMAGHEGLSTESQLVQLGAGGSATVSLILHNGVVSLRGQVRGVDTLGAVGGLGGATVTATDGTITRTATTVTVGPVGSYVLPDLPAPGNYTVTIGAPGYQQQTQAVTLGAGASAVTVNAVLGSASATISGSVRGAVLDQNGQPTGAIEAAVNAGIVLSSSNNSYKITTTSDGSFRINGVQPGDYVISAQYAGLITGYQRVHAVIGRTATVSFNLAAQSVAYSTAGITGYAASAISPSGTIGCSSAPCDVTFALTDSSGAAVAITPTSQPAASDGPTRYTVKPASASGLPPGLYHLTVGAPGFLSAHVAVQVPLEGAATAPQVSLFPADTITGTVNALSNPSQNPPGYPAATYGNCVWAVPVDPANPTDYQAIANRCTGAQPDQRACQQTGKPAAAYATIDPVTLQYTIGGLCDGTYNVVVVVENPYFVSPAPTAQESVSHGQTVNYSPHLQRHGAVTLTVNQLSSGVVAPFGANQQVAAACGAATPVTLTTDGRSQITVYGLPSGQAMTCTASGTAGAGSVSGVSSSDDQTVSATVTLTQPIGTTFGQVVSTWGDPAHQPVLVAGTTVTVTGIVGYDGATPQTATATVTANASGCFAVAASGASVTAPSGCGTLAAANIATLAPHGLVSDSVTLTLTAPGYVPLNGQSYLLGSTDATQLRLNPRTVAFAGRITANQALDLSQATVQVDTSGAAGAGPVQVFADPAGNLYWISANGFDQVWPGSYTLTVTLPGYASPPVPFACAIGAGSCGPGTINLVQLGSLTGTVTGYLGGNTADSTPHRPLSGAAVTAAPCGTDATCANPGTPLTTSTDANGNYTFATSSGLGVLTPGYWQISVSDPGWHASSASGDLPGTQIIDIQSGQQTAPGMALLVQTVTLTVTLTNNGTTYGADCGSATPPASGCPSVVLVPLGSQNPIAASPNPDSNGVYTFAGLIPNSYTLAITDDSGVVVSQYVPINIQVPNGGGTTIPVSIPITLTRGTVSGIVDGAQGKDGTPKAVTGISVSLGSVDGNGDFQVATGTDNKPLTAQSVDNPVTGSFAFTTVPPGSYVAQYSDPTGNYQTVVGTSVVTIYSGSTATLPTVTLPRSTANVTVKITLPAGDSITDATVGLASPDDPSWTFTPQPPTGGAATSWEFLAVQSGTWTLTVTLPKYHYGSLGSGMTCPAGTETAQVTCTGTITVTNQDVTQPYTLTEYQLGFSAWAKALATDTQPSAPTKANVTVTDPSGNTAYSSGTFHVADAAPGTATATIWGRSDVTYSITASTGLANWPDVTANVSTSTVNRVLEIDEVGGSVAVTVTGADGKGLAGASITLERSDGVTINAPGTTSSTGLLTVLKVPFGTWTATATKGTVTGSSTPFTVSTTGTVPVSITAK